MHLGNAWTAFLAWLDIRQKCGTMVLRIEDLDPDRSRPEYSQALMADLRWLGLDWDEGPDIGGSCAPYMQSERSALYQEALGKLVQANLIYPCYCSRAELRASASAPHAGELEVPYSGCCRRISEGVLEKRKIQSRQAALRLKVNEETIAFYDEIFGLQQQSLARSCGDFVVRRSDGVFAYQLAVVVDDATMGISRVVRGADLLASTPRQIYLWNLLGYSSPTFLHVPLLIDNSGERLSKRHGALTIASLRRAGIKPEMIIGQLATWAGLIEKNERVSAKELICGFNPANLPQKPVVCEKYIFFGK
jgi:glutamyl-tRNA synthetase